MSPRYGSSAADEIDPIDRLILVVAALLGTMVALALLLGHVALAFAGHPTQPLAPPAALHGAAGWAAHLTDPAAGYPPPLAANSPVPWACGSPSSPWSRSQPSPWPVL